ncbi:MAG TPA: TolC family protein, partial [Bacteroidota bacterium]
MIRWTIIRWNRAGLPPLVVVAAALISLTGCTVGPDYVRPSAETPPAYKETEGTSWKVAQPRDELKRGAWWEIFGDPGLNGLEVQVRISNQNIAAAEAQYRQARALVQAARAAYFPTITADGSYTRSRRPVISGSSGISGGTTSLRSGSTTSDYLLSGSASWEPDIWGKVRRSVESSEAGAQASAADLEALALSTQAELATDYFQLRTLDAQKQMFDATVKAYQTFLDLTKNRYASGVASRA